MKAYTIGYDLDKPGQNYEKLIARLKQHGAVRILLSQWALQTTWSAVQLRDDLKTYTDSNDRILVAGLTLGGHPKPASEGHLKTGQL